MQPPRMLQSNPNKGKKEGNSCTYIVCDALDLDIV